VAELDAYFRRIAAELRLTEEARAGFRMWANAPVPPLAGTAEGRLPRRWPRWPRVAAGWARGLYGLPPWEFALLEPGHGRNLPRCGWHARHPGTAARRPRPCSAATSTRALELMRADLPTPAAAYPEPGTA